MLSAVSEREDAVRGLRAYHKKLLVELKGVEAALTALTGSEPAAAITRSRGGATAASKNTTEREELIREVLTTSPNEAWTAQSLLSALNSRGWTSDAANPENSLRTALSRLHQEGLVERVNRGTYRWIFESNATEAFTDEADTSGQPTESVT